MYVTDSNTYGYAPACLGAVDTQEERWTALVEAKTGSSVKNYGLCGRKIPRYEAQFQCVREQMEVWIQESERVSLWIMLGTNDFLENERNMAEEVAFRMETFLNSIKKKQKKVEYLFF